MPCGQFVRAKLLRGVQQGPELDGPVAQGAGVGRAARRIGSGKRSQHLALENRAQIGNMQGHAKCSAGLFKTGRGRKIGFRQKKTVQGQYPVPCLLQHDKGAKTVHSPLTATATVQGDVVVLLTAILSSLKQFNFGLVMTP